MNIRWKSFSPQQFEELCFALLQANKFSNLKWHGKSGQDKGRDIIATKGESPLRGVQIESKWVIQCKRLIQSQLTKGQIQEWLASCQEHRPDFALLIVTTTLRSSLKDWINTVSSDYRFRVIIWEEKDLEQQVDLHRARLSRLFPQLLKTEKTVLFHAVETGEFELVCNEFAEVFIKVVNESNYKAAKKKAEEFILFVKANSASLD